VVGLGYVGLSVAVAAACAGHRVTGIEVDAERLRALAAGRSYISDVDGAHVRQLMDNHRFDLAASVLSAGRADAWIIAVPTPVDDLRRPDTSILENVASDIACVAGRGTLVVLESTTYPGTTEQIIVPALEQRGFRPGVDILIGYSPERIDPGNQAWTVTNTPKLVAGLTPQCLTATRLLYSSFVSSVVPVSSVRAAEMAKVYENSWRLLNVVFANELDNMCRTFDLDAREITDACATKPFGYLPFYPGPGAGGHCLPVDSLYLLAQAQRLGCEAPMLELACQLNSERPAQIVASVERMLQGEARTVDGSNVMLVGVSYKRNVPDIRETPALPIIRQLRQAGANVTFHDPHVDAVEVDGRRLESSALSPALLGQQDCVVIVTDHDSVDWDLIWRHWERVVDTRHIVPRDALPVGSGRPLGVAADAHAQAPAWVSAADVVEHDRVG
jgi:UDP-N-acetyl-D-glucosamine dehydrogenase